MRSAISSLVVACCSFAATAAPLQVMPMGDSITYGVYVPGGYRDELYARLTVAGIEIQLVGAGAENASPALAAAGQAAHNGVPYFGTQQIRNALSGPPDPVPDGPWGNSGYWLSGPPGGAPVFPDVILLQVGTNDLGFWGETVASTAANLGALIGDITTARPDALLIVAQVTPRTDSEAADSANREYNALIPAIVQGYASMGRRVSMVDQYHAIDPLVDLPDGLHPGAEGYVKIGRVWADAVVAAAPEPSSAGSVALAVVLLIRCRRRARSSRRSRSASWRESAR